MAQLFGKIDSDIRMGVGCRGHKKLTSRTLFNHEGNNTEDGGVIVESVWLGESVDMDISILHNGKKEFLARVMFHKSKPITISPKG